MHGLRGIPHSLRARGGAGLRISAAQPGGSKVEMLALWEEGGEDDRAVADLMAALGGKLPVASGSYALALNNLPSFRSSPLRRIAKPIPPKPSSIIAHVAGSGTAGVALMLMIEDWPGVQATPAKFR